MGEIDSTSEAMVVLQVAAVSLPPVLWVSKFKAVGEGPGVKADTGGSMLPGDKDVIMADEDAIEVEVIGIIGIIEDMENGGKCDDE